MDKGSNNMTTTTQAPNWQLPYQQTGLNQSLSQYQNQNQLVAPFAPQQEQAISNITNMAKAGDPATQAAQKYITSTLGGNVQTNPMLDQLFKQGANQIQLQLGSQFGGAGRNIGESAGVNAQALGNFGANLYGNAFNTETGAQTAALAAAPQNLQSQLGLQNALFGAGGNVQNLAQQYIQAPQTALNQYLARVTGNLGSTQATPMYQNQAANAIGLGSLGSGIGSTIGGMFGGSGSDWGSILGGIGGGLLGLL